MRSRCLSLTLAFVAYAAGPWPLRAAGDPPPLKPGEHIENFYSPRYLIQHGWKIPYPPYPEKARLDHEEGRVYLHLVTDKTGQVIKTTVLPTPLNTRSKTLRQVVTLWALYKWSGPPSASTNIEFEFRLIHHLH